ncbi:hypothetical protein GcC1_155024 [Golovinomyces cichoracearum]|uniref:Uncharacterized protein n=1 Tax=Golovinomyces cichoracearum TaxID=62708 RepID=A0A420HW54_9PEZI|nr:hypothetical protein GcC1_155024 [Golovinomyces cichoracearum]
MDIENLIIYDLQNHKVRKTEHKWARKALRQLREVLERLRNGPIDYKKLAEDIQVEVSLMDLFQISSDLSKAFRLLSTRANERSGKLNEQRVKSSFFGDVAQHRYDKIGLRRSQQEERKIFKMEQKAFRIPVTIKIQRNGRIVNLTMTKNAA